MVPGFCFLARFLYINSEKYFNIMEEKKTAITLINGDILRIDNGAIACPCCMNGSMLLMDNCTTSAGFINDELVFECVKCRATLTVPYVSLKEE